MEDILIDDNNDILIENGDFVFGPSDLQHQKLLLLCEKGSFKESPLAGVGVFSFLEAENRAGLYAEIRNQFSADGMRVNGIVFENGKIMVDAEYQNP